MKQQIRNLTFVLAPITAEEALRELAQRNGWELPEVHLNDPGWRYEELGPDSTIPDQGVEIARAVRLAGIPIKGWLIGHEPPKPVSVKQKHLNWILPTLVALGVVVAVVGLVWLIVTVLPVLIGLGILLLGCRIDPQLCAVLDDGVDEEGNPREVVICLYAWFD